VAAIGRTAVFTPNSKLHSGWGGRKSCALRLALAGRISLWLRCTADPNLRDSRERIKAVARRRSGSSGISWIVLEHAEALHRDAQAFLRRVIETALGSTRFVLEVRDPAGIAEPLLSRCILTCIPTPLPHEIRTELRRRVPALTLQRADEIVAEAAGNVRWAVLQAVGNGDCQVDRAIPVLEDVRGWNDLLRLAERIQETGSVGRAYLREYVSDAAWERPGGACPWATLAAAVISAPEFAQAT